MTDNDYLTALKEVSKAFSTDQDGVKITGGSTSALISGVFSVLRAKKLKKELDSVNGIFFFDDLERFGGNISIPMAFMSNVIEVGNSKCVVLCNENNFLENPDSSKQKFNLFKEKVIGRTVRFEYEEEEFIDILLQISGTESELNKLLHLCIGRLNVALHYIKKEEMKGHNDERLKKYDPHYLFCAENGHRKNIRSCQKALMLLEELLKTKRHFLFNNPFRVLSIFILTLDMLDQQTHPEKYGKKYPRPISHFGYHDAQKEGAEDEIVRLWLSEGYLLQIKIDNLFLDWSPCEITNYLARENEINAIRVADFIALSRHESVLPKFREIAKNVRLGFPWSLRDTLLVFEWGLWESSFPVQKDWKEILDVTMNIFESAWKYVENDLVLREKYHWSRTTIKNWKVEAKFDDLEDWKSYNLLNLMDGDERDSFQTKFRDDCYPRFKSVIDALN
tara:strand:- start:1177 stop:2523 length:1347 start_codon:yes stop_codon:yes gene_type:complete